jgi:hypothetical protein
MLNAKHSQKMVAAFSGAIAAAGLSSVLCLLLYSACSKFDQDNPFDIDGANWHPPALIVMGDTSVWAGDALRLHATATDDNGTIQRFEWNFGSRTAITSAGVYDTTFSLVGSQTAVVTAYDNDNIPSNSRTIAITVRDKKAVLNISRTSLDFGSSKTADTFSIFNTGFDPLNWSILSSASWISISPKTGSTTNNRRVITVSVNRDSLSVGNYSGIITVTAGSETKQVRVTMNVAANLTTITVRNYLILPINVFVNNVFAMKIPADETLTDTISPSISSMTVSWALVRPIVDGEYVGEFMGDVFTTIQNPTGNHPYSVINVIDSTFYFAPVIKNSTTTDIIIAVNWDLASEIRCPGHIPASNGLSYHIGYYTLFSNTQVAAFKYGSNYTGTWWYWRYGIEFSYSDINVLSGRVDLTF